MSQPLPKAPLTTDWAAIRSTPSAPETGQLWPAPSPSLTYEHHYGLKEKPFSLSADPRFLYRSPAHAPAFDELLNGIRRREGLIVLTGEIGTGKTTLIRSVLQHLDRRTFTAFVPDPFVSREDLLKMLLVDFGVVSLADLKRGSLAGASRPDLSYPLYEFLDSLVPLQAFAVLIIDEAQNLPLTLLEEIRILSDLEQREKLLQVVLVGQPELRTHLKMPQMRQVDQRVSVRCELTALGLEDVGNYVRHRLAVASDGGSLAQFSDAAMRAIFDASGGTPRVINLICDRALQRGHNAGAEVITPSLITDAVTSLGIEAPPAIVVTTTARVEADKEHATIAPATTSTALQVGAIRSARRVQQPMLSEFAAEADADGPLSGSRFWRIAAAMIVVALVLAGAGTTLLVAARRVDVAAAKLPDPPLWTTATPSVPSIDLARELDSLPAPATVNKANDGSYAILVASFGSRSRADRLVTELTEAGFRARTVEFNLGSPGGVVLQIRVDGYASAAQAEGDLSRIRELPGYGDARLVLK